VLGPGLADEGAHVDETRRNDPAAAVDGLGSLRHPRGADAAPRIPDHAVGDQHVFRFVEIDTAVADGAQSLIREQVEMGVAVRMAVLEALSRNLPNA